ncbi:cell division control protein 2 homolog [Pistacia vera]|uniref:cell division control protein 2 homolog n=1 Tax=Pistacia vera TaxID=55513 RepID=UPI001263B9B4|nr:cell division control protein 2 homolog [Pistacia vera]
MRASGRVEQLLVQWQGLPLEDASWENTIEMEAVYGLIPSNLEGKVVPDGEGHVRKVDSKEIRKSKRDKMNTTFALAFYAVCIIAVRPMWSKDHYEMREYNADVSKDEDDFSILAKRRCFQYGLVGFELPCFISCLHELILQHCSVLRSGRVQAVATETRIYVSVALVITLPNMASMRKRFPSDAMNKKYTVDKTFRDSKYGLIRNGVERDTGRLVAFKFIEKSNELEELPNLESPSLITRETSKIMGLNHPNVTRCLRTETDDTFLYLVFENLPWDLDDFGRGQAKIENQVSIKHILQGILHGIEYLRSQNCVHEDLRPEFVLFDPDSKRVKVAYFGEPKSMDDLVNDWCLDNPGEALKAASLYYQAPEILFKGSSKVVDMWAVGCIFGEMLTGRPLFPSNTWLHILANIFRVLGEPKPEVNGKIEITIDGLLTLSKNFDYKDLAKEFPSLEPAGVDLISRMLCLDPDQRITPREALEHEYFKDL